LFLLEQNGVAPVRPGNSTVANDRIGNRLARGESSVESNSPSPQPSESAVRTYLSLRKRISAIGVASRITVSQRRTKGFLGGTIRGRPYADALTLSLDLSPGGVRSRVALYNQFGSLILAPLGYAIVGIVARHIGVRQRSGAVRFGLSGSTLAVLVLPALRTYRAPTSEIGDVAVSIS
jgi:hypothetical protein